jgi:hypothetical protein
MSNTRAVRRVFVMEKDGSGTRFFFRALWYSQVKYHCNSVQYFLFLSILQEIRQWTLYRQQFRSHLAVPNRDNTSMSSENIIGKTVTDQLGTGRLAFERRSFRLPVALG